MTLIDLQNQLRTAQNQLNAVNIFAARGQYKGSPSPCDKRPNGDDCGAWRQAQQLPSAGELNNTIRNLESEIKLLQEQEAIKNAVDISANPLNQLGEPLQKNLGPVLLIGGLVIGAILLRN